MALLFGGLCRACKSPDRGKGVLWRCCCGVWCRFAALLVGAGSKDRVRAACFGWVTLGVALRVPLLGPLFSV